MNRNLEQKWLRTDRPINIPLSRRNRKILDFVKAPKTTREIALHAGITEKTAGVELRYLKGLGFVKEVY